MADNIFLLVRGPSLIVPNGFRKPTEIVSSALFQGTPSIFVSWEWVPTTNFA